MNLEKGSSVTVIERVPKDWVLCLSDSGPLCIPAALLDTSPVPTQTPAPVVNPIPSSQDTQAPPVIPPPQPPAFPRQVTAQYAFAPDAKYPPTVLPLTASETLTVLSVDGKWATVRKQDGTQGQVPSNYLNL